MTLNRALATVMKDWARGLMTLVLAFAATATGCKKDPDQALVVLDVKVAAEITDFTDLTFSVDSPAGIPSKHFTNANNDHRMFTFGYYMPGVNADTLTIRGRALNGGCVVGEGTLPVMGVKAGQTLNT